MPVITYRECNLSRELIVQRFLLCLCWAKKALFPIKCGESQYNKADEVCCVVGNKVGGDDILIYSAVHVSRGTFSSGLDPYYSW